MTPRAKEIIEEVAQRHGVPFDQIVGDNRTRKACMARFEAMYRVRSVTRPNGSPIYSLPRIGAIFGDRDHSTVLLAVRRWTELSGAPPIVFSTTGTPWARSRDTLLQMAAEHAALAAECLAAAEEAA